MLGRSLLSNLRKLQRAQYRHDQFAHQDIAGLPVPQRVTHFTLHFSKYVGGLAKAIRDEDQALIRRLVTDSFVIALAAANAMNIDLHRRSQDDSLAEGYRALELEELGSLQAVLMRYAETVGEMSKASEALDHMEDFPSRRVQERSVALLLVIISRMAEIIGLDLPTAAKERWKGIEQKPRIGSEGPIDDTSHLHKVA